MMKRTISKFACLICTLTVVFTTCGWVPFTAPVTIHSTPEGAEVYRAGEELPVGVTPFDTRVFISSKEFEVRLDKYHSETLTLGYNSPKEVHVTLSPKPVLVYSKPSAEIYAEGSDLPLGKTSWETFMEVDIFAEDRNYVLKAEDYYDKEITLGLATENPVVVELEHRPIITLSAVQSGVEIYENGVFISDAPMTKEILEPRSFELRKEGFYKKVVELTSNSPYDVTAELAPLPVIEIKAIPATASIYLLGKPASLGTSPLKMTIEEKTAFEVKAPRYYPETVTVETRSQLVEVTLKPMPYVTVNSTPSGANLYQGDTFIGVTPIEQLIETPTSYELRKEGYISKTVSLDGKESYPVITLEEVPPPEPIVSEEASVAVEEVTEAPVAVEEEGQKKMPLLLIIVILALIIAAGVMAFRKKS